MPCCEVIWQTSGLSALAIRALIISPTKRASFRSILICIFTVVVGPGATESRRFEVSITITGGFRSLSNEETPQGAGSQERPGRFGAERVTARCTGDSQGR